MKAVHFVLDETGSMAAMQDEAITSYNGYLDTLANSGDLVCALTKFDSTKFELVHPMVPVRDAVRLDNENYRPGASTPLFDAVCHVIKQTEQMSRELEGKNGQRCDVLIVILTDGEENSSQEYDADGMNALIKEHEDAWGWSFAYIGASVEAWRNERAFAGTILASNALQSSGDTGLVSAMQVTAQTVADWSVSGLGTRHAYGDQNKQEVREKSKD
jgi:hypothetical protein